MCRKTQSSRRTDPVSSDRGLAGGFYGSGDLAELLELPLMLVSHHLKVLLEYGFVQRKKEGRFVYYSLGDDVLRMTSSISAAANSAFLLQKISDPSRVESSNQLLMNLKSIPSDSAFRLRAATFARSGHSNNLNCEP